MTLTASSPTVLIRKFNPSQRRNHLLSAFAAVASILLPCAAPATAQDVPAASADVLVLSNGDTLHGKLVSEVEGKITFHTDSLGDISLGWDKVKELHTARKFAVLDKNIKLHAKKNAQQIPIGTVEVTGKTVAVHPDSAAAPASIPVNDAQYIMDEATMDKQLHHAPGFLSGWNGAATAGATVVTATQNQFTFSGGVGIVRVVPTASWLNPRDRTSADFIGSFGKITQPAYRVGDVIVPAVVTKSAIYHADAERDQYFSPRFFALGQVA